MLLTFWIKYLLKFMIERVQSPVHPGSNQLQTISTYAAR